MYIQQHQDPIQATTWILTPSHSRAVTRAMVTANHSRAVTRVINANHSRAVAAAGRS